MSDSHQHVDSTPEKVKYFYKYYFVSTDLLTVVCVIIVIKTVAPLLSPALVTSRDHFSVLQPLSALQVISIHQSLTFTSQLRDLWELNTSQHISDLLVMRSVHK